MIIEVYDGMCLNEPMRMKDFPHLIGYFSQIPKNYDYECTIHDTLQMKLGHMQQG